MIFYLKPFLFILSLYREPLSLDTTVANDEDVLGVALYAAVLNGVVEVKGVAVLAAPAVLLALVLVLTSA